MAQYDVRPKNPGGAFSGGSHVNFEVVVATPALTLAHYYRDNSPGSQTWYATEEFGNGNYATLIKSNDFQSLEVVASSETLAHFRRNANGGDWTQTRTFAAGYGGGTAGFVQDSFLPVIVP
jgi:hypothetical protein